MDDLISRKELRNAMYHEAFEIDSDLQKWDGGCWIRYKLFENVIDSIPSKQPPVNETAVEPKQVDLYGKDEWWGLVCICPDCKAEWMSDKADTHFCPKCGRPVKWE